MLTGGCSARNHLNELDMRVLFFGNHTVGVRTLGTIAKMAEIVGVIAHPSDPEDGVKYLSVYEFASQQGWNVIRSSGKAPQLENFIMKTAPDLIWVTDYRYLLPPSVLNLAPLGAVNLHPSLLPKYRGRAPVNWAIINGERELGLTAHFIDEEMDGGDIIEQFRYDLTENQDIQDALEILYPLYEGITQKVLTHFLADHVPRHPQNHNQATVFPRRRPEDGLIDWAKSAEQVCNLIRAVAWPYPGAFSFWQGQKIIIWSADLYTGQTIDNTMSGQVLMSDRICFAVAAGKGAVLVKKAIIADTEESIILNTGDLLETQ